MTQPRVLVSVLNFNSGGDALETIACLKQQDYPAMDLVVFDNDSKDGSREAIEQANPDLRVINTRANLGYTGGNNAALELGLREGYDAVIIANHDIRLDPDVVRRMMALAADPAIGVVGAQEVDAVSGERRVLGGRRFDFWRSRRQWIKDPEEIGVPHGPVPMHHVQGALVLFTRRALERGVRLNDEMFAYADEIDLGFQVERAGLRAVVDSEALVHHESRGRAFGVVEGYLTQRNRWYLVRHYGSPVQRAVNLLWTGLIELPFKAGLRTLQGHGRYARACVLGFVDGLRGVTGMGRIARL